MKKWTDAMVVEFYRRRCAGERFVDIGREHGLKCQRMRQLVMRGRQKDIADWKFANGWYVREGGRWVDPPLPWPEYPGPGWR